MPMKIIYTLIFLLTTACILSHSQLALSYSLMGLKLWFDNMVPALLPFMILSGIMIRMNLTGLFTRFLYFIIRPIYRVSENVCYGMIMGFLCGFPMGAKTVADLLKKDMISKQEAEFLLCFNNNIGPVYFCSFVLPLLNRKLILPYIFGMYAIPLLYGFVLRYTAYRHLTDNADILSKKASPNSQETKPDLLNEVDNAINSSIESILSLGGYMILFNLLNLLPHVMIGEPPIYFSPLLEITGGLKLLGNSLPLYSLLLLSFGGFSCIAQTNNCIKGTSLSINHYLKHKLILTALNACYYLGWFLLLPNSFLR